MHGLLVHRLPRALLHVLQQGKRGLIEYLSQRRGQLLQLLASNLAGQRQQILFDNAPGVGGSRAINSRLAIEGEALGFSEAMRIGVGEINPADDVVHRVLAGTILRDLIPHEHDDDRAHTETDGNPDGDETAAGAEFAEQLDRRVRTILSNLGPT